MIYLISVDVDEKEWPNNNGDKLVGKAIKTIFSSSRLD